jgi:hypothetical protein
MSIDGIGDVPQFAFNGDAKARDSAVDRLRRRILDGELDLRQTQSWDVQALRGSLMGTTVHSADAAVYQEATGIPAPLAVLQETLFTLRIEWVLVSMDPPRVEAAPGSLDIPPERWLAEMPLDVDLRPVTSRFLHYLLSWVMAHEMTRAVSAAVKISMHEVAGLHADAASGHSPVPSVWARIRNAAILATDAAVDDASRTLGAIAETVAWPPEEDPSASAMAVANIVGMLENSASDVHYTTEQHEQLEARKVAVQRVLDELDTQDRDVARAATRNLPEVVATSTPEWEALRKTAELARRSVRRQLANQFHEELVRCLARR